MRVLEGERTTGADSGAQIDETSAHSHAGAGD